MTPLSALRTTRHAAGFVRAFLSNVKRPDADAVLRMERHGSALASPEDTRRYIEALLADAPTRALLEDRWMPEPYTIDQLLALPEDTLGYAYGRHLSDHGLSVEFYPDIDTSREDEFVRARLYQTHDIIHALTGYDASDAGEMGIIGFYVAQYLTHHDKGGLMAGSFTTLLGASVLLHAATVDDSQLQPFWEHLVEGYLRGKASRCLIGPRWELMLDQPIASLRAEYAIPPRTLAPVEVRASA